MFASSISSAQTAGGSTVGTAISLGLVGSLSAGESLPVDVRLGLPPAPIVSPGSSFAATPAQTAASSPIALAAAVPFAVTRTAASANAFASALQASPQFGTGLANQAPVAIAGAIGLPVLGFIQSAGLAGGAGLPVSVAGGAGVINPWGWLTASFLLGYGIGKLGLWAWDWLNKISSSQYVIPERTVVASGAWNPTGSNLWTVTVSGTYYDNSGPGSSACTVVPFVETRDFSTSNGGQIWVQLPKATSFYTCFNFGPNGVPGFGAADIRSGTIGTSVGASFMANRQNQTIGASITVRPGSGAGVPYDPTAVGLVAAPKPRTLPPILPISEPGPDEKPKPVPPLFDPIPIGDPIRETTPDPILPLPLPFPPRLPSGPGLPAAPPATTPTTPSGGVQSQPKPLVPVTPPDWHFINGQPIPDGGVRPDLASIATEVGRIEQKVALIHAPQSLAEGGFLKELWDLVRAFMASQDQGTYSLRGVCEVDTEGFPIDNLLEVPWGGSLIAMENLASRIDALAILLQHHKNLKQPTCPPERFQPQGDWVTIHFISDEPSPMGAKPLRKQFRYRDQTSTGHDAHVAHWLGFSWQAGPVCVQHADHAWGTPQVWASSVDEGKRVIRHAGQVAGVDPDAVGRWVVSGSRSGRIGQAGTMRVQERAGVTRISMRDGSDASPLVPIVKFDP